MKTIILLIFTMLFSSFFLYAACLNVFTDRKRIKTAHKSKSRCSLVHSFQYTFGDLIKNKIVSFQNSQQKVDRIQVRKNTNELNFGTYLGKGVLSMLPQLQLSQYHNPMILEIDTNESPQFLIFYLAFPPGNMLINPFQVNWIYNFTNNANIYQIFSLLTTASTNTNGETIIKFFNNMNKVILPFAGIQALRTRIAHTKSYFQAKTLLLTNLDALDNYITSNNQVFTETREHVNFEVNDQVPLYSAPSIPQITLQSDTILYAWTDETTHLWLNTARNSLFIVDAGSQILTAGIANILRMNEITTINIFLTHFHLDHVQGLAGLIWTAYAANRVIKIYVHEYNALELSGYLAENLHFLLTTDNKIKVEVHLLHDGITNIDGVGVQPIHSHKFNIPSSGDAKTIRHFITCTSYVFFEPGKCVKVFTGDINPNPPANGNSNNWASINLYFQNIFGAIDVQKNCAHVFWDYGHFLGGTVFEYKNELQNSQYNSKNGQRMNIAFYYEHNKNPAGFNLVKEELDQNLQQTKLFPNNCGS